MSNISIKVQPRIKLIPSVAGLPIGIPGLDNHKLYLQTTTDNPKLTLSQWLAAQKGTDGREVQINVSETHLQWRLVGDEEWTNIIALADLMGKDFKFSDFTPEQLEALKIQGDSAFIVWQKIEGNEEKTEDDYFAYLRQPATDAAQASETLNTNITTAENGRVTAENGRVTWYNAAVIWYNSAVSAISTALQNIATAIQNAVTATSNANDAASLANNKAGLADTATTNANNATTAANNAASTTNQLAENVASAEAERVSVGLSLQLKIQSDITILTTGDGKYIYTIPAKLNGYAIESIHASLTTASSSGLPQFKVYNLRSAAEILSTNVTIDATEFSSYTALTQHVVNAANKGVLTGDRLRIDCVDAGTGAKGFGLIIKFVKP